MILKRLLLILLIFKFSSSYSQIYSGIYNHKLIFGYDVRKDSVTGFFANYDNWDEESNRPEYDCMIYFKGGRASENNFNLEGYNPLLSNSWENKFKARIIVGEPGAFKIFVESEPAGCGSKFSFLSSPGFKMDTLKLWRAIKIVKSSKAGLRKSPVAKEKIWKMLYQKDIVKVLDQQEGWVQLEYRAKRRTIVGWVPLKEISFY